DIQSAVYRDILAGRGYGLAEARAAVELVHNLRAAHVVERPALAHPALTRTRVPSQTLNASWPPPRE
ncbi:MAG: hypothetical protein ACHQ53_19650, partial [Polyangiales bacterium]